MIIYLGEENYYNKSLAVEIHAKIPLHEKGSRANLNDGKNANYGRITNYSHYKLPKLQKRIKVKKKYVSDYINLPLLHFIQVLYL